MPRSFVFAAAWWFLALAACVQASGPVVVFVHGLYGWGPDEIGGVIKYWNPIYLEEFRSRGFQVHEASVGPISSNWDRACELYAQIKGTVTDYGKAHSETFGHTRFGKNYTGQGLYPEWSAKNRIHLIAHSLGGNTVRYLEALLQKGDADEVRATGGSTSPLFAGQGNWIQSVSAISSPLDGSPPSPNESNNIDEQPETDILQQVLVGLAGLTDGTVFQDLYDFDLDHWGIFRNPGESFQSYFDRIKNSALLEDSNVDVAFKDNVEKLFLRTDQTYAGTYYFGYATYQTYPTFACKPPRSWFAFPTCGWVHKPRPEMWFVLSPTAVQLGGFDTRADYRENDGTVLTNSMYCPKFYYANGEQGCERYRGVWKSGKWMYERIQQDHIQIIGFTARYAFENKFFYAKIAERILKISNPTYDADKEWQKQLESERSDSLQNSDQDSDVTFSVTALAISSGIFMTALVVFAILFARRKNAAFRSEITTTGSVLPPTFSDSPAMPSADKSSSPIISSNPLYKGP